MLLTLLLCWPLFVFGRPAYFADTLGYVHGGRTATMFVVHQFAPLSGSLDAAADGSADDHGVKAARSIPYSVLAYALRGSDGAMMPLAVLQVLLTAFAVTVFLSAAPVSDRRFWGVAAVLALATPAAWVSGCAMPDVFAGVTILIIATLSFRAARLTTTVAVLLSLIGAFAIASHASHIAIAIVLLPLALWLGSRTNAPDRRRAVIWLVAPAAIAVVAVLATAIIGFGDISLAPKRYPLTLARSIGNGPARWYLERHCEREHYAVCEIYGTALPRTSNDFLWGPNGINRRATPEQMARLRAEEPDILRRTIAAYPLAEAAAALRDSARQLISFRIDEANFNQRIEQAGGDEPTLVDDPKMSATAQRVADGIFAVTAALALGWVVLGLRTIPRDRRAMLAVLLAGLLVNAAVCAILSGVSDRYQARVIWLLPLAAALASRPRRLTASPQTR